MERRVFILLVLLIVSVILNIFLVTKVIKFRKLVGSFNEYTNSIQNKFGDYEKKVNRIENDMENRVRDKTKNINKSNINNSIPNK